MYASVNHRTPPYFFFGIPIAKNPQQLLSLRTEVFDAAVRHTHGGGPIRVYLLRRHVPFDQVRELATGPRAAPRAGRESDRTTARRARDYIDADAGEPPTIEAVCQAARVSWRALDYAFRENFGVTPKQYFQATRLDGVRKDLHLKGPTTKITDAANRWGFWHMGQFARDYRRQFGELPSDTLRRVGRA